MSGIRAQDEAVYLREAIEMARSGEWATPTYLGRYALNKPPLTQWLAAASMRTFGVSAWSARVPSLVAAALLAALVFAFAWKLYSPVAAAAAVILLAGSHLYYVFARLLLTDMLLAWWVSAAIFALLLDPSLRRRRTSIAFGACAGAAILAKGAAGFLPFLALTLLSAWCGRNDRPRPGRLLIAAAAAAAVALPWHLYQLAAHPRWFVAEYVLTQHLAIGVTAPPQYSAENHLLFYARRLFLMDPVLAVASLAGLALLIRRWRQNRLVLAWIGALLLALFSFRYRSAYYLLPLLPALALCAASLIDRLGRRARAATLALLLACVAVKTAASSELWGLPSGEGAQLQAAAPLEAHCRQARANDLILVEAADQFYAGSLPLRRIRYCLPAPARHSASLHPPLDFDWLGISIDASDFGRLAALLPQYRQRLAGFGLPSDAPVATVIWTHSDADIARLIDGHPEADFFLSGALLRRLPAPGRHRIRPAGNGFVFLLAPVAGLHSPGWSCEL